MNKPPNYLTLPELERWQYANGNVEEAAIIRDAMECGEAGKRYSRDSRALETWATAQARSARIEKARRS